ncbi:MAG: hypothetical protein M1818_008377 [Claussenomyces sp. TS43310]|nr:MAG: hypothetical protein M1818_008377 [Claussenomyces sp. TS43310]
MQSFGGIVFESNTPLPGSKVSRGDLLLSSILTSLRSEVTDPRDLLEATDKQESGLGETIEQGRKAITGTPDFSRLIFDYNSFPWANVPWPSPLSKASLDNSRQGGSERHEGSASSVVKMLLDDSRQVGDERHEGPTSSAMKEFDGSPQLGGRYTDSLAFRIRHESSRASRDEPAFAKFSPDLSVLTVEGFCVAGIDEF